MRAIFIFIDGLGIGKNNPESNPCTDSRLQIFNNFLDQPRQHAIPFGGQVKPLDATLGIAGLPQSATGQATLLTGINAAKLLGRHLSGYPNQILRELLAKESIMTKLKLKGKRPSFINAYRPIFFAFNPQALIKFLSVTSIVNWKAGLPFFSFEDVRARKSIYHDFTNAGPIAKGFNLPRFTAIDAGEILARTAAAYDFCLYEYFNTDRIGHTQSVVEAGELLYQLEILILTAISNTDLEACLILLTSDHGNIEDSRVKTHTTNPVPLVAWGKRSAELISRSNSIQDVAHILLEFLA